MASLQTKYTQFIFIVCTPYPSHLYPNRQNPVTSLWSGINFLHTDVVGTENVENLKIAPWTNRSKIGQWFKDLLKTIMITTETDKIIMCIHSEFFLRKIPEKQIHKPQQLIAELCIVLCYVRSLDQNINLCVKIRRLFVPTLCYTSLLRRWYRLSYDLQNII